MLDNSLEEQAALFASGALPTAEREWFAVVLEAFPEMRRLVRDFEEVSAYATASHAREVSARPSGSLRDRILGLVGTQPRRRTAEGLVVTEPDGGVIWINNDFEQLCGYSLEEIKGRKLGHILQGKLTDPATAARMRNAVHARQACRADLVNYKKSGEAYWVGVELAPVHDSEGRMRWYAAREWEVEGEPLAA